MCFINRPTNTVDKAPTSGLFFAPSTSSSTEKNVEDKAGLQAPGNKPAFSVPKHFVPPAFAVDSGSITVHNIMCLCPDVTLSQIRAAGNSCIDPTLKSPLVLPSSADHPVPPTGVLFGTNPRTEAKSDSSSSDDIPNLGCIPSPSLLIASCRNELDACSSKLASSSGSAIRWEIIPKMTKISDELDRLEKLANLLNDMADKFTVSTPNTRESFISQATPLLVSFATNVQNSSLLEFEKHRLFSLLSAYSDILSFYTQ